jgi:S1-C subfamily serine protease
VGAKIGVRAGDVITGIDGGTVSTGADLRRRLQRLEAGDEFTLAIVRDKKTLSLKGKLDPAPARTGAGRVIL